MSEEVRVRFAPSPTGNVHIGNIRVAIFNWLYAKSQHGKFLLRIEDTDRERSTDEAIAAMLEAMQWLGLTHDEAPMYQTAQYPHHKQAIDKMLNFEYAYHNSDATPAVVLKICKELFDPSFVTEPKDKVTVDTSKATYLRGTMRNLVLINVSEKSGQEYTTPMPWDSIESDLVFNLENGGTVSGEDVIKSVMEKCGPNISEENSCDINEITESKVVNISFNRRYVFFEDIILGKCEKPLDSLKDQVIVRGDGTPVFHIANVVDDANQNVTHILRGNDHVENSFRHLFLFKAIGKEPPKYGHFPMIVNEKGKPYSKRDGDAYVGDFQDKGFLPEALFNFLALCGWAPGDDREMMSKEEMVEAFTLKRVNKSAAQFNIEKLEWLNGKYLAEKPKEELVELTKEELIEAGINVDGIESKWLLHLIELQKERIRTLKEFAQKSMYFFDCEIKIDFENKNVRKATKKDSIIKVLTDMSEILPTLNEWDELSIETAIKKYMEVNEIKMGEIAQPLRIALTGNTVSPGIYETLYLVGKDRSIERIKAAIPVIENYKKS
jgi:glutamyl-tRNA synthetase